MRYNITCRKCGEEKYQSEFWLFQGEPDNGTGLHCDKCKDCYCQEVEKGEVELIDIFKELDAPYIFEDWKLINDIFTLTLRQKVSRYLSKMRLKANRSFRFSDSERINQINEEREMRRRGLNV